jgi:hypothetical protein
MENKTLHEVLIWFDEQTRNLEDGIWSTTLLHKNNPWFKTIGKEEFEYAVAKLIGEEDLIMENISVSLKKEFWTINTTTQGRYRAKNDYYLNLDEQIKKKLGMKKKKKLI